MKWIFICLSTMILCNCTQIPVRHIQGFARPATTKMTDSPIWIPDVEMHTGPIVKIVSHAEKQYIVTASLDKTAKIWNLETRELLATLRVPIGSGPEGKIYAVAISPNGDRVAISGWTGLGWEGYSSIYVFDTKNGTLVHRISSIPNVIHHLDYSKRGTFLVAALGGRDGLRIYDTIDYKQVYLDRRYQGACHTAEFNSTGMLVTTSSDGFIRLYNRDFSLIARRKAKNKSLSYPNKVSFSPEGHKIAVIYKNSLIVEVFTLGETGFVYEYSKEVKGFNEAILHAVCWGVDGSLCVAGNFRNQSQKTVIRRWVKAAYDVFQDIPAANHEILDLFPLSKSRIVFATADPSFGIVYEQHLLWRQIPTIVDHRGADKTLHVSADGTLIKFIYNNHDKKQISRYFSLKALASQDSASALSFRKPKDKKNKDIAITKTNTQGDGQLRISHWFNGQTPKLNGHSLISMNPYERSRSMAIASSRKFFILGSDHFLRCFEKSGKLQWKLSTPGIVWAINIAYNNKIVVVALGDGTIRWYKTADGEELLAFLPHRDQRRWVAWNKNGFYASSIGGTNLVKQHKNKNIELDPEIIPLKPESYQPQTVAQTILPIESSTQSKLQLAQASPETLLRGVKKQKSHTQLKDLNEETLNITADYDCEPKNPGTSNKPHLYILAIGVNYQKPELKLNFAEKDARDFIAAMRQQHRYLYGQVCIKSLLGKQANRSEILKQLKWIIRATSANDVAMIFMAGHGVKDDNGYFYFLPYDFSNKDLDITAIPFARIQDTARKLRGKTMFFIDTCRSGSTFGHKRIDMDRLVIELSEKGGNELVILASSTGDQVSAEKNGNGVFTKSLLEGLAGKAAKKREISILRLALYVSERVRELTNDRQTPTIAIPGSISDFPVARLEKN